MRPKIAQGSVEDAGERRWISFKSTWEPTHPESGMPVQSKYWGEPCVQFVFTNRDLKDGEFEIGPEGFMHYGSIRKCESDRRHMLNPLFPHDLGFWEWNIKCAESESHSG